MIEISEKISDVSGDYVGIPKLFDGGKRILGEVYVAFAKFSKGQHCGFKGSGFKAILVFFA